MTVLSGEANVPAAIETLGLSKRYVLHRIRQCVLHPTRLFRGGSSNLVALQAVDSLDLIVHPGEVFGFVGPNGAGKSTTMRMLLGLMRPTLGSAVVLGLPVRSETQQILARTGAIIENPTFYPFLSGRDNLRLVAHLKGADMSEVETALSTVDLTGAAKGKFSTYSLGMKQRLAVGAALLGDPDLLILDEPANGLDPAGIVEMRKLMARLKESGKTVFISSHVLHEIQQICDRIAIVNHGRLVTTGPVSALLGGARHILVRVDDAERAAAILRDVDGVDQVTVEQNMVIVHAAPELASDVNRALAHADMFASEIRPRDISLEEYFLQVTGDEGAPSDVTAGASSADAAPSADQAS
jgi:ABC-2 type transport system ATP-binding protein